MRTKKSGTKKTRQYIKPGFLVVGDVTSTGCVSYEIRDRKEKVTDNKERAHWKTDKFVSNVKEQRDLVRTGTSLKRKISKLGARIGNVGCIVPMDRGKALEEAIRQIEQDVDEYNGLARETSLFASIAVFQIAATDDRVALMLYNKTTELLTRVADAIKDGNVVELRRQIQRLKGLDSVMSGSTAKQVGKVIKQARNAAKLVTKKVKDLDEKKAMKVAKKMLKGVPVNAVRADVVEYVKKIRKQTAHLSPVDVRQLD